MYLVVMLRASTRVRGVKETFMAVPLSLSTFTLRGAFCGSVGGGGQGGVREGMSEEQSREEDREEEE